MKVLEDVNPSMSRLLGEITTLQQELLKAQDALRTFAEAKKAARSNGVQPPASLPAYLASTRSVLMGLQINNFSNDYPALSSMVANGNAEFEGAGRLYDCVYQLGQLRKKLAAMSYMVKSDTDRNDLSDYNNQSLADLAVFTITQYGLYNLDDGVCMSIFNACNERGVSPDIMYGEQLNILETTGKSVYGYECISEFRDDMMEIDPVFLAECEEADYPLDAEKCRAIVNGEVPIVVARGDLLEYMKSGVYVEREDTKGMTTLNMLKKLSLD